MQEKHTVKLGVSSLSVFFSYSHRDSMAGSLTSFVQRAVDVCNAKETTLPLHLFVDDSGILPGDAWRATINDSLANTHIFLPCITPNYCLSAECAYEYKRFEDLRRNDGIGRTCVPLFWEDIPSEYFEIQSFRRDILDAARAINGIDVTSLVMRRTSSRSLMEEELVADLACALERAARWVEESLAAERSFASNDEADGAGQTIRYKCAGSKDRSTFTMRSPAPCVVFNAITDDPSWGDERGFTLIKDVTGLPNTLDTASAGDFVEVAQAIDRHIYMVKSFVHHCSASNLKLIAEDVRLNAFISPGAVKDAMIQVSVHAGNVGATREHPEGEQGSVWDEAYLTCPENCSFKVAYIAGSGRYYNAVRGLESEPFELPDDIVSKKGALLGYERLDGRIPGCFAYSGYATFLVMVQAEKTQCSLGIRAKDEKAADWNTLAAIRPGETVLVRMDYKNTGIKTDQDVVISASLPSTLRLVPGTTKLYNATHPSGVTIDDAWVFNGGNIGSYAPGSNAVVAFSVRLGDEAVSQGVRAAEILAHVITKDGEEFAALRLRVGDGAQLDNLSTGLSASSAFR